MGRRAPAERTGAGGPGDQQGHHLEGDTDRLEHLLRHGRDLPEVTPDGPGDDPAGLGDDPAGLGDDPAGLGDDPAGLVGDDLAGPGDGGEGDGDETGVVAGRHRQGRRRPDGPRPGRVALLSVPESLRSFDLGVGWSAVRGMLLVAVVALVVLGGRWWWLSARADVGEPVHLGAGAVEEAPAAGGPETGTGGAGAATAVSPQEGPAPGESAAPAPTGAQAATAVPEQPATLLVHVAGQVQDPGVVEVTGGSRVIDVVRAAGGFTKEADQSALNLARPVLDGEQVWVGRPGEEPPVPLGQGPAAGAPGSAPGPAGSGSGGPGTGTTGAGGTGTGAGGLVDLNHADQAQLEELPGIGPVTAERILAWREEHGRFTAVEELLEVSGIGERTFAQLQPLVTVGP